MNSGLLSITFAVCNHTLLLGVSGTSIIPSVSTSVQRGISGTRINRRQVWRGRIEVPHANDLI